MSFGAHLIFDAYNCDKSALNDSEGLKRLLDELVTDLKMHKITDPVIVEVGPNNKKDPGGVSGFVMISESHMSFHTFPNRGFLSADIYTCQDDLSGDYILEKLCEYFKTKDFDHQIIKRGFRYPDTNIHET